MSSSVIVAQRPSFAARRFGSAQSFSPGTFTTILFNDKLLDTHSQYNPSTGLFTCTIPGVYQFNTSVRLSTASGSLGLSFLQLQRNSLQVRGQEIPNVTGGAIALTQSYLAQINVNDVIRIVGFASSSGNVLIDNIDNTLELAHFSGFKID